MRELVTEHRGYKIAYAENRDVWWCHELDLEGATLTKVKDAINKTILKAAKATKVCPAIYIGYSNDVIETTITSYAGTAYSEKPNQHHVWTVRQERRGGKQRSKEPMSRVMLDTPENRTWAAELLRLTKVAREAQKAVSDYKDTMPSVTLEELIEKGVITGKIEGADGEERDV